MKIKQSELCETCKKKDFIEHFFFNCSKLSGFWENVSNTILKYTDKIFEMSEMNVMMGFDNEYKKYTSMEIGVANHILLIAKMSVSKMKYRCEKYPRDIHRIFEEEIALREKYLTL